MSNNSTPSVASTETVAKPELSEFQKMQQEIADSFSKMPGRRGNSAEGPKPIKYVLVTTNCEPAIGAKLYGDAEFTAVSEWSDNYTCYKYGLSIVDSFRGNKPIAGQRTSWKGSGRNGDPEKVCYFWLGVHEGKDGKKTYRAVQCYNVTYYNELLKAQEEKKAKAAQSAQSPKPADTAPTMPANGTEKGKGDSK